MFDVMIASSDRRVVLFPTPDLTAQDRQVIDQTDQMRTALRHAVHHPTKETAGLRTFLTADAVAASNSIEGFKVATVDVEDLMEGESEVDISEENREETLAYQRMMTYARDPSIAAYTAPEAPLVAALTQELIDWLNDSDGAHALVRAAMAHLHLVSIHPWADGNGRMSRSLQTLMIAREGVLAPEFSSIESWLGRPGNTWEYYRQLGELGSRYQPDQDVSGWIRFNLTAYHQQAQTVQGRLARSGRVWNSLAAFAAAQGLDERTVTALHDVAMAGRVRRSRYQHGEALSLQQAQRDLRDLTAAEILKPVGRTRARYCRRFPSDALDIAQTPMTLTHPYRD